MKNKINFDMDAAIRALREGKDLSGQEGILTPLIKQLTEAAMQAELDAHLAGEDAPNRRAIPGTAGDRDSGDSIPISQQASAGSADERSRISQLEPFSVHW